MSVSKAATKIARREDNHSYDLPQLRTTGLPSQPEVKLIRQAAVHCVSWYDLPRRNLDRSAVLNSRLCIPLHENTANDCGSMPVTAGEAIKWISVRKYQEEEKEQKNCVLKRVFPVLTLRTKCSAKIAPVLFMWASKPRC